MPSIFNTFGFSTNAALSKKNYFNEDCLEFRLLATQMCDDLEMAEYVRTENYRFKKYWLLATKAQMKEKVDKMKERINQFIFSPENSAENTATNAAVNISGFLTHKNFFSKSTFRIGKRFKNNQGTSIYKSKFTRCRQKI